MSLTSSQIVKKYIYKHIRFLFLPLFPSFLPFPLVPGGRRGVVFKKLLRDARLAQSGEHAILHLGVVSSSSTLGVEIT